MSIEDRRWSALAEEAAHLRTAAATRAPMEQAKGVVSLLARCTPDEAWQQIRRVSADHDVRVSDLCQTLVAVVAGLDVSRHDPVVRRAVLDAWALEPTAVPGGLDGGADDITTALAAQAPVEQAKGVLSFVLASTPDEAYGQLRRAAMKHGAPLPEVCATLVDACAGSDLAGRSEAAQRAVAGEWAMDLVRAWLDLRGEPRR